MWGLVSPENEVTKEEKNIDSTVATKQGWRWLSIVDLPSPIYNSKLQCIDGPYFNVTGEIIERYWNVRDKILDEIESDKRTIITSIPQIVIDILFIQENKIRELNQQTLLNKEEFINYIKSIM